MKGQGEKLKLGFHSVHNCTECQHDHEHHRFVGNEVRCAMCEADARWVKLGRDLSR